MLLVVVGVKGRQYFGARNKAQCWRFARWFARREGISIDEVPITRVLMVLSRNFEGELVIPLPLFLPMERAQGRKWGLSVRWESIRKVKVYVREIEFVDIDYYRFCERYPSTRFHCSKQMPDIQNFKKRCFRMAVMGGTWKEKMAPNDLYSWTSLKAWKFRHQSEKRIWKLLTGNNK